MTDAWTLAGRVAIVTGAGRGIGRGCAIELARAGAEVVLVSRTQSDLDEVAGVIRASGGVAHVRAGDAADEATVAEMVAAAEAHGDLGVLVASAGLNRPGASRDYPMDDWDYLFHVNVRATFLACRAVGGSLLRRERPGSIITMSSQMGAVGLPERVAYCSSKHAVNGLTKALAVEWARAGIRVNAVAPTFVETQMTARFLADPEFRSEVLDRRIPIGRFASIEEVAYAVRYLACEASASVTGAILAVDGGWTAQ